MYNINNKNYKYLEKLYQNNTYKYNDNILKLILLKEKNLKKLLNLINIKGKIKIIEIKQKENIQIDFEIKNKKKKIIITNKPLNIHKKNTIKIFLSENQEKLENFKCITYQTLYEKILSKIKTRTVKQYVKQLQKPTTDEHIGLIITKKEKKYIKKIIKNKKFIKSLNNNEFYQKNQKIIHIILNKYIKINQNSKEINNILYKNGYNYKNTKYKNMSDIILEMFKILKEKNYEYKDLKKLINICGDSQKLLVSLNEIKSMSFPYYYDLKKYIEFDNKKYYVYTGWYRCDYADLKFRINNLKDEKVDYSIIKI